MAPSGVVMNTRLCAVIRRASTKRESSASEMSIVKTLRTPVPSRIGTAHVMPISP